MYLANLDFWVNSEILQGSIKKFLGFSRGFQGFKNFPGLFQGFLGLPKNFQGSPGFQNFPGFSRIPRACTNPLYNVITSYHSTHLVSCTSFRKCNTSNDEHNQSRSYSGIGYSKILQRRQLMFTNARFENSFCSGEHHSNSVLVQTKMKLV